MKRLIIDLLIVFGVFVLVNITVRVAWVYYVPSHCDNHINNPKVTTLVIGSSMSECSVNDSILTNCLNLSESGLWFCANYNSLRWVCEYTDQKIDTVICCVGLPSFINFARSPGLNSPEWIHQTERYSQICYNDFLNDFALSYNGIKTVCTPLNRFDFEIKKLGGKYQWLERDKLKDKEATKTFRIWQEICGQHGFSENVLRKEAWKQVKYLRKISDYCKNKKIVFIVFNAPTYHADKYIDYKGYKDYILHEFGPNQLVADYDNFTFPNDSYYGDYFHLNHKGATYLCNYIKNHGWKLTTASVYIK